MNQQWLAYAVSILSLASFGLSGAWAQNQVTMTPLGSNQGMFCASDRAILFEDPGPGNVRILIAPGRTVNGPNDQRLGAVDVILLDHAHVDHIGDRAGDNNCSGGGGTSLTGTGIPNVANIAAGKNSAVLVGGELVPWLQERIGVVKGNAIGGCGGYGPTSGVGTLTEVRRSTPCVDTLRPGASRALQVGGVPTGVTVSVVQATHSNGIPTPFINNGAALIPPGLSGYGGTETGYVIRFSNGLSVYWTGDSGLIGDMQLFSQYYGVNLAIVHMGDVFTMGPDEAAFAVSDLIKPRTVIPEHANEVATDSNGNVLNGTRTERFLSRLRPNIRHIVPLSGVPIYCDGRGNCSQ